MIPGGTVDPQRVVSEEEQKALVTIEAVERLTVKVHNLLTPEHGEEGVDEVTRLEAQCLLESMVDLCTTRTATAVKQQVLSDEISGLAREKVYAVLADTERRMAPLKEGKA